VVDGHRIITYTLHKNESMAHNEPDEPVIRYYTEMVLRFTKLGG
jgi:hypothetical protein